MSKNTAERRQNEFDVVLNILSRYFPRNEKYIKAKSELDNAKKNFTRGEKKNIGEFKNGIFLLIKEDFQSDGQRLHLPPLSDSSIDESHGLIDK